MNLRSARRLLARLYERGLLSCDIYKALSERQLTVTFNNKYRVYRLRVFVGIDYLSTGPCAFRCLKRLAERSLNFSRFQGQPVDMDPVRTTNKLEFIVKIKESQSPGFPIVSCPNYGTISFLQKVKPHNEVTNAIRNVDTIGRGVLEEAEEHYHHSSEVTETDLLVPAFNKLATKPSVPLNRDVVKRLILLRIARLAKDKKLKAEAIDLRGPSQAAVTRNLKSASGIVPVKPIPGVSTRLAGSKEDLKISYCS